MRKHVRRNKHCILCLARGRCGPSGVLPREQMFARQFVSAVLCGVILVSICVGSCGCKRSSPASDVAAEECDLDEVIHLSDEIVDFGHVKVPAVMKRNIRIKNDGSRSIKLIVSRSSCGCLMVTNDVTDIQPHQEAVVGISVRVDKPGKYYQTIILAFEVPGQRAYKVIRVRTDAVKWDGADENKAQCLFVTACLRLKQGQTKDAREILQKLTDQYRSTSVATKASQLAARIK